MCGAISGSFTSLILTPIELIKCKMQVQGNAANPFPGSLGASARKTSTHTLTAPRLPGPLTLIQDIVKVYGVRGLWHGQMGTFLRETGGSAAWFGAYEYVSMKLRSWGKKAKNSPGDQMLAGALGAFCDFSALQL